MQQVLLINARNDHMNDFRDYVEHRYADCRVRVRVLPHFLPRHFAAKWQILLQYAVTVVSGLFVIPDMLKSDAVILNGNPVVPPTLLIGMFFPFRKRKTRLVAIHFFLQQWGQNRLVQRILRRLMNHEHVTVVALSRADQSYYHALAPKARVDFYPFCCPSVPFRIPEEARLITEEYIFAGGATNRDYDALIRAVRGGGRKVVIATGRTPLLKDCPDNVEVRYQVPLEEFNNYLYHAAVVVIPLKEDIGASGQSVALAAMASGRPVIYSDLGCIRDYFDDSTGRRFRPGDADDLRTQIENLLSCPNQAAAMAERARQRFYSMLSQKRFYDYLYNLAIQD